MVAGDANTNAAGAIDYCCSAAKARALIHACGDVSRFALYDQPHFKHEMRMLHDNRKGADRFRRKDIVYEVLCERVLFGGEILPVHVAKWFDMHGAQLHEDYLEKHGSDHMFTCYDVYRRQVSENGLSPVFYKFLVGYHKYTKYLPLVMYLKAVFNKKHAMGASVKTLIERGCDYDLIKLFVSVENIKDIAKSQSPLEKKRMRRFNRVIKSDPIRQLYSLTQMVVSVKGCNEIYPMVLSFLQ